MKINELKHIKRVRKVTMLTAYDYQMAKILDRAGVDILLVGDSLGMVVLGYKDTKQVTMPDMIRATEAVARGTQSAMVVADMPIDTYKTVENTLTNAGLLIDAGADAIKIEGYHHEEIDALLSSGIPVMGHLGLLPQTAEEMKVKGKKKSEAEQIISDALALDSLGVFSIVLECIPYRLACRVTEGIKALTIGIGAGVHCDGQVLVINDMLGMDSEFNPKHNKQYTNLDEIITRAVQNYIQEVKTEKFPTEKNSFH